MARDPRAPASDASRAKTSRNASGPPDPLVGPAARVAGGDSAAGAELVAGLESFLPQLFSLVKRNRAPHLAEKIDSEGVIFAAINSLLTGLPKGEFPDLATAANIHKLLNTIVLNKLRSEARAYKTGKRDAAREVRSEDGRPRSASDPAISPTDAPLELLLAFEDSGRHGRGLTTDPAAVDVAAGKLVKWLSEWAEQLRSVHPDAMDIIELSFRGRTNRDIAAELGLGLRRLQQIKESLRDVLTRKLVRGEHIDVAAAPVQD